MRRRHSRHPEGEGACFSGVFRIETKQVGGAEGGRPLVDEQGQDGHGGKGGSTGGDGQGSVGEALVRVASVERMVEGAGVVQS